MKKTLLYLSLISFFMATIGCEKYVSQDDANPNQPTVATLQTLTPAVEVALFATYTGSMARNSGVWIQHFQGTDQQMQQIANYSITENDVQNDWTTIYNAGVVNSLEIISKGTSLGSPYYKGIGEVLKAMLLGIATDFWGDIPDHEAGLGVANLNPHYETQQSVISDIQSLLDDAIAQFSLPTTSNLVLPASDDYIHGGDAAAWKITAYMLKARYANRLSQRDAAGSATTALSAIDGAAAAGMSSTAQDANAIFSSATNSSNSWYAFEQQRGNYMKMSATLVDTLRGSSDPRLQIYAALDDTGGYSGTALNDISTTTTSSIGSYYGGADAFTLPLVTYVEAKYIEAEAALRSGDGARAQTAYAAGLSEALHRYDAAYDSAGAANVAPYITAHGILIGTPTQMLAQIMYQKWIAMFTQPEAWADWRRTGYPLLTPHSGGVSPTIPLRYPTEQNERLYNTNATVVSNSTSPVWWDN